MKILNTVFLLSLLASTAVQAHQAPIVSDGSQQLCYLSSNDIGSHEWLKKASLFHSVLASASSERVDTCWSLDSDAKAKEAYLLVAIDATQTTLVIK